MQIEVIRRLNERNLIVKYTHDYVKNNTKTLICDFCGKYLFCMIVAGLQTKFLCRHQNRFNLEDQWLLTNPIILSLWHQMWNPLSQGATLLRYTSFHAFRGRARVILMEEIPTPSPNGPLARYVKLRVAYAPGMPGTFSPPPRFSDPNMHRGTCLTHAPWCMPWSLTSGFLWSWRRGKCSRHFRPMRNPQFYVFGKRPITLHLFLPTTSIFAVQ